jgi:hypothetical protein
MRCVVLSEKFIVPGNVPVIVPGPKHPHGAASQAKEPRGSAKGSAKGDYGFFFGSRKIAEILRKMSGKSGTGAGLLMRDQGQALSGQFWLGTIPECDGSATGRC